MIRIMAVDNDVNRLKALKQYFRSSNEIEVVSTLSSLEEYNNFNEKNVDFIVVNFMLNGLDGYKILSDSLKKEIKSIVFSDIITDDMIKHINKCKPCYVLKSPFSCNDLNDVISVLTEDLKPISKSDEEELELVITNLLHTLGVPSHVKGFNYIRECIKLMYYDKSYIGAITKRLYPDVAKKYLSTFSKVERAIRHAIEVAWNRGDYDKMEEIFGNSVDFDRAKPTNSEFIVTLADRIRLERKYN